MASRQPQMFTQAQPRTYRLNLKAALSFPFRLCNPPPAVGKVRSCGVTPLIKVRLEDVLDRQHLPPLGLKDFEEWLLFVEMSPENLYFTLWLREYKQRYNQWKAQTAFQNKNESTEYSINWSAQYSSHLAMFYARAKQTFFTPGSEYELNLTSSILAPFHKANMPPHPDPELFAEVELETYRMLDESLRRFVQAQFNNVGNNRVLCGIVAGVIFSIIGSIPPLAQNFARGGERWSRLAALPGLWIGLTILLSSLNGICLGIYIFGDLRQLRKFELSRPTISKPQPLPAFRRRSMAHSRPLSTSNSILPIQQPRKVSIPGSVHGDGGNFSSHPLHRMPSILSVASHASHATRSSSSSDDNIQISPAYYDADDIDGPEAAIYYSDTGHGDSEYRFPAEKNQQQKRHGTGDEVDSTDAASMALASPIDSESTFMATATFIHPFEFADNGLEDPEEALERSAQLPARHQPVFPFDFDALPSRAGFAKPRYNVPSSSIPAPLQLRKTIAMQLPTPPERAAPASFLARFQERCNIARWRLQTGYFESESPYGGAQHTSHKSYNPQQPHWSSPYWSAHPNHSSTSSNSYSGAKQPSSESEKMPNGWEGTTEREKKAKKRFRMVNAVPAFAVPLTRVLSPVIVRGQWEIVVRSSLVAFLLAWVLVGSLLAVPPRRRS